MRHLPLPLLSAIGTMLLAEPAHAATPTTFGRFAPDSVIVGVHNSIPPNCIQPIINAINTWNSAGANFTFFPDFLIPTPRPEEQTAQYNNANVTIDDGVLQDPRAVMGARVDDDSATKMIRNADIRVDKRRILNNPGNDSGQIQLDCTTAGAVPPGVVDWQSAILHEFGHVVGLNHDAIDIGCSMYEFIGPGQNQRTLCPAEKQVYVNNYKHLRITGIPNVSGPYLADIPAKILYEGTGRFPLKRETVNTSCASGWTCSTYNGDYPSSAASPLTFNFRCGSSDPESATFGWRTTLVDVNGVRTNSIDHTSTCTSSAGSFKSDQSEMQPGVKRVIVTD